jgi:5-methylcytosine-specific restriction endonuclease McrA
MSAPDTYNKLLRHPEWFARRREILQRDDHTCRCCGASEHLHVHHRAYLYHATTGQPVLPWAYPDHLLIVLCDSCHAAGHQIHKIPTLQTTAL